MSDSDLLLPEYEYICSQIKEMAMTTYTQGVLIKAIECCDAYQRDKGVVDYIVNIMVKDNEDKFEYRNISGSRTLTDILGNKKKEYIEFDQEDQTNKFVLREMMKSKIIYELVNKLRTDAILTAMGQAQLDNMGTLVFEKYNKMDLFDDLNREFHGTCVGINKLVQNLEEAF